MTNLTKLFNSAVRLLNIGTTQNEFATNYANASEALKGTSIWKEYYQKGIEEYKTINIDGHDGISQEEFKKIEYLVKRLNRTDVFDLSLEDTTGNNFINDIQICIKEPLKSDKTYTESNGLKPVSLMNIDEVLNEIQNLDLDFVYTEDQDIKILRKTLLTLRYEQSTFDKNSDIVDYNIGSFNQGFFGSCTMLSSINGLTENQLRQMIEEGVKNGKEGYYVTFPIDMHLNNNNGYTKTNTQFISKEELQSQEIVIEDKTLTGFSTGDLDVSLIEMAYIKRFGVDIVYNGADLKIVREIFAFPEDNYRPISDSKTLPEDYMITEEKLLEASQEGKHAVVALKHARNLPDNFSYTENFSSKYSDISTSWELYGADKIMARKNLKRDLNLSDEEFSKYQSMSDCEFMDIANRFISNSFGFSAGLKLSNGLEITENHAFSVVSYNSETKIVTLSDPHANNESIEIPLDIMQNYFDISI